MWQIEQLLHGYRRGHERLAGSVKLPPRDADLITRLSDLSGSLTDVSTFAPYLTVYPLPLSSYYAAARTWLDVSAPRAGCVLTHTLLIPVAAWLTMPQPAMLESLFHPPLGRDSDAEYERSLQVSSPPPIRKLPAKPEPSIAELSFVQRYFGEAQQPVVWFGRAEPDATLWLILRHLWPSLRSRFASCTFCLQPRSLEDRSFDVMFAPTAVYPRFLKIGASHFVDEAAAATEATPEPWCRGWARRLFGPVEPSDAPVTDLWDNLDEDPASVRRLYLVDMLLEQPPAVPQSAVGAMDLVESIARRPEAAAHSKLKVATNAVKAALAAPSSEDGLESLWLIETRLGRASYAGIAPIIGPQVAAATSSYAERQPEAAASAAAKILDSDGFANTWFGRGIVSGFRNLLAARPDALLSLKDAPSLVASDPAITSAYATMLVCRRNEKTVRDALRSSLESSYPSIKAEVKRLAIPHISRGDADLLLPLLRGIDCAEVQPTLQALASSDALSDETIFAIVAERVADIFPYETRSSAEALGLSQSTVARLFARTFLRTKRGLLDLLQLSLGPRDSRVVVSEFLSPLVSGRLPYWVRELASEDPRLLSALLDPTPPVDPPSDEVIGKLLSEQPDLPLAHLNGVMPRVLQSRSRPFFRAIHEAALRDAISGYVTGAVAQEVCVPIFEIPESAEWFRSVAIGDLRSLIVRDAWNRPGIWANAWHFLSIAPRPLYEREPAAVPEIVEALLHSYQNAWSQDVARTWADILRRARAECRTRHTRLVLAVQALKFGLHATGYPMSDIVVESFDEVYTAVTTSSTLPPETAPLFGIFDWDKGKELRKELVSAFMDSNWPPGDLALATKHGALLRKIFKRLTNKWGGERYAQAMLADLRGRSDKAADDCAKALGDMIHHPDFQEDWD